MIDQLRANSLPQRSAFIPGWCSLTISKISKLLSIISVVRRTLSSCNLWKCAPTYSCFPGTPIGIMQVNPPSSALMPSIKPASNHGPLNRYSTQPDSMAGLVKTYRMFFALVYPIHMSPAGYSTGTNACTGAGANGRRTCPSIQTPSPANKSGSRSAAVNGNSTSSLLSSRGLPSMESTRYRSIRSRNASGRSSTKKTWLARRSSRATCRSCVDPHPPRMRTQQKICAKKRIRPMQGMIHTGPAVPSNQSVTAKVAA